MFTNISGKALSSQVAGKLKPLSILGNFLVLAATSTKETTSGQIAGVPIGVDVVGTDTQH
jgi:hypothetical protein